MTRYTPSCYCIGEDEYRKCYDMHWNYWVYKCTNKRKWISVKSRNLKFVCCLNPWCLFYHILYSRKIYITILLYGFWLPLWYLPTCYVFFLFLNTSIYLYSMYVTVLPLDVSKQSFLINADKLDLTYNDTVFGERSLHSVPITDNINIFVAYVVLKFMSTTLLYHIDI